MEPSRDCYLWYFALSVRVMHFLNKVYRPNLDAVLVAHKREPTTDDEFQKLEDRATTELLSASEFDADKGTRESNRAATAEILARLTGNCYLIRTDSKQGKLLKVLGVMVRTTGGSLLLKVRIRDGKVCKVSGQEGLGNMLKPPFTNVRWDRTIENGTEAYIKMMRGTYFIQSCNEDFAVSLAKDVRLFYIKDKIHQLIELSNKDIVIE